MLNKIASWLRGDDWMAEGFTRFMLPIVEEMRVAGVPEDEIDRMVKAAIKKSDPTSGIYPGGALRREFNAWLEFQDAEAR